MVRGRKGSMGQSQKKPKVSRISRQKAGEPMAYFNAPNDDKKILFLPEYAVETLKKNKSRTDCQFSFAKRRLVSEDFER